MRSQGLGGPWSDAFTGVLSTAANAYKDKVQSRIAQQQLAQQQQYELAQSTPQSVLSSTPGGGLGLIVGLGIVAVIFMVARKR